jgi:CRISPR system Cascade subunit CasA
MNLLSEPWMPVRQRDGHRAWINPMQLSSPDIAAFDADRADFNGALAQFAIGLLQTTTPIDSPAEWRRLFKEPPTAGSLEGWFAPVRVAFEFDGDGARFMQDFSLKPEDGAACDISALLIETPGENTLKNNVDHFVKRARVEHLCPHCAATALFTLQVNAPAGGVGHRTGLRGGGPLTTLLVAPEGSSLWQHLWLNVMERERFMPDGVSDRSAAHFTFPWLADMPAIQKEGGETAPVQTHPAHVFWAMPRRIRMNLSTRPSGTCDICGRESNELLGQYVTRNYGLNYKGGWNHPFSPYYESNEAWLPLHPQPGGLGYRHWLAWVLGQTNERKRQRRARIVEHFLTHRTRTAPGALRLWAFGYDMDNMKARCWYESTLPLYGLVECDSKGQERVEAEVAYWLLGAELVASYLRSAVKNAWFSGDARGDFNAVDAAFWGRTELRFYGQLRELIEMVAAGRSIDTVTVKKAWLAHLEETARRLFDGEFVGAGAVDQQDPRRIAQAYQLLVRSLRGPKLRDALGLPADKATKLTASKVARAPAITGDKP